MRVSIPDIPHLSHRPELVVERLEPNQREIVDEASLCVRGGRVEKGRPCGKVPRRDVVVS